MTREKTPAPTGHNSGLECSSSLGALFTALVGRYPNPDDATINYPEGIRGSAELTDNVIAQDGELPAEVIGSITPLGLTANGIVWRTNISSSSWLSPEIVLGDGTNFDDLVLFWNLRAAGAELWFYDQANRKRLRASVDAFVAAMRASPPGPWKRFNVWSRSEQWNCDLDLEGLNAFQCRGWSLAWNGLNVIPIQPRFSFWRRDVVPAYNDSSEGAVASFGLPDQPFDFEDPTAFGQRFVATVDANQFGPASEDQTFNALCISRLNDFYARNSYSQFEGFERNQGI